MVLPEYTFKSHFLEIGGRKLHYLDEGSGSPVLLLHGNPTWSYYYRNLITHLSRNFRVIALDHMGCGLSDKPVDYNYSLAKHIENTAVLVDHLHLDTLSMVVHDWGGAIGFGFATRNAERIKSAVILNTAAFRSSRIPLRIRICRWPVIGKLIVQGLNGFALPALSMAVKRPLPKPIAAGYLYPYDSWQHRVALYQFVKDIPLTPDHPSYETLLKIEENLPRLSEKKTPVQVLWGGKDFCFNDHFYHRWKFFFPEAEYHYFKEYGHYVLEDGKGVLEPLIETFIADSI